MKQPIKENITFWFYLKKIMNLAKYIIDETEPN